MRKLGEICELKIINVIKNITENNVKQPIFCTFYTIDNGYQEYFRNLKKSLKKFKLDYYAAEIYRRDYLWEEIGQLKPQLLEKVLVEYPSRNIVWVDSDSIIEKPPVLFESIPEKYSFGVHYLYGKELCSGTLFFRNDQWGFKILTDWKNKILKFNRLFKEGRVERKKLWDQKILQKVIGGDINIKTRVYNLPPEYLCIFDNTSCSRNDWVISHWQAARKMKHRNGTI